MKFGFVFPGGDARTAANFARAAETAGWDGFFVWEPVWGVDAWVSLTAAAMQTGHIRLGTMLTPLSRMRPWKLAGETAALDNLSNGRVILSVGLGAVDTGFAAFGEVTDRKTRAELLDEGLDILTGLWRGQPFNYSGKHYRIKETSFMPPAPPVQQPLIPIWVVGAWPHEKSMQRALRYDGLLPSVMKRDKKGVRQPAQARLEDLDHIAAYIRSHRDPALPYEIVIEGETPGNDPAGAREKVQTWVAAGATWWIEAMWSAPNLEKVMARIEQGPPKDE
jgi:alkanesulfonate monooxygenase SsuD/methylene tetrahydromethanopterin reductase-like flavin-dependent oxidoreductase (luciferase family)